MSCPSFFHCSGRKGGTQWSIDSRSNCYFIHAPVIITRSEFFSGHHIPQWIGDGSTVDRFTLPVVSVQGVGVAVANSLSLSRKPLGIGDFASLLKRAGNISYRASRAVAMTDQYFVLSLSLRKQPAELRGLTSLFP